MRVGVYGQVLKGIKQRYSPAGTHAAMGDPCGGKAVFDHKSGFFSGLFHISVMQLPGQLENIGFMMFMHQDALFFHGFFRIKNPFKFFIFNFNQVDCFFCNFRGLGCHSSYFIPERAYLAFFYGRVVLVESHDHFRGNIFPGDNRMDSGQSFCF